MWCSPMRNPGGYAIILDPEAPTKENDTFTCGHCQRVVFVKPLAPPSDLGGWCGGCAKLLCPRCEQIKAQTLTCRPIEKWLEQQEARDRTRRSLGL